jgi:hypothetical protein
LNFSKTIIILSFQSFVKQDDFVARQLSPSYFAGATLDIAPKLIGCILDVNGVSGRIVEVEAYTDDPASHGFRRTARSSIVTRDIWICLCIFHLWCKLLC